MKSSRWTKIQTIFEQALQIDEGNRDAFLVQACEGDSVLLGEVKSLLESDGESNSLLDLDAFESVTPAEILDLTGKRIGAYELIRELGHGGMGSVFLARRVDGDFEQNVALKLIKHGFGSEDLIRRFQSERQILARLEHPNIARLLDGGISEDGWPFFTMEYVEGLPIDEYCNRNRLSVDQRLRLFQPVCAAVQYAHRSLVIHRDLKPSNILVTTEGAVKLLDFGIAKVLSEDESIGPNQPALTKIGSFLMTPEYAAPEQVRSQPVTTATDVYSMGVILYELLTGHRPYRFETRTPTEMERVICDSEPTRPSTFVIRQREGSVSEKISETFASTPKRLRHKLSGDLDNICLKALRKEPQRRYSSAEQLLSDIERYLTNRPIHARGDSVGYRARKFAQRNRVLLTGVMAVIAIVVVVIAFYTVRLRAERDIAKLEAEKAAQVSRFLTELFKVSDPEVSRGEEITARELLDLGARRIEFELTNQPEVKANILSVIGKVYESLGSYDKADLYLNESLMLEKQVKGETDPGVVHALHALASLKTEKGRFATAESLVTAALQLAAGIEDFPALAHCKVLMLQGALAMEGGHFDRADSLYNIVLTTQERELPPGHIDFAETFTSLASLQLDFGDAQKAEEFYRKALTIQQDNLGENSPAVATTLNDLAYSIREQGDLETSEALYRETLALNQRLYGEEHPNTAWTLNHLARLLSLRGKYAEAEPLARDALRIRLRTVHAGHPAVAASRGNLAGILMRTGKLDEAESLYRENLRLLTGEMGDEHPYAAAAMNSVAAVLLIANNLKESESYFNKSLALHRKLFPENHPNLARPLQGLGRVYLGLGNLTQAESLLSEAFTVSTAAQSDSHWRTAEIEMWLGKCLMQQRKNADARRHLEHARQVFKNQKNLDPALLREIEEVLGELSALE
jgi:serine/threonine-protein kinase